MQNRTLSDRMLIQVVATSAVALFIIFGIRLSFSVFFAEFISVEGWSSAQGSSIFSVSMLAFAISAPPTGFLLDRYGPRVVFSVGAALLGVGLYMSSRAQSIEALIFAYGVVGGVGLGVIGLGPMAGNITSWVPPAARGRAIGIAFAGTGLGSLIFVPLSERLITIFGWRQTYLILSGVCFFVLVPMLLTLLRKPPPRQPTPDATGTTARAIPPRELLANPWFWLLMLIAFSALGPLRALTVHQIAYMESVGVDRPVAARYVGLAGFITTGAFIGWGVISDRLGRAWTFTLGALALMGAVGLLFALRAAHPPALLLGYAVLYALGEGTRSSQTTALASDTFNNAGLGLVNSLVGALFGLGAAFGPWLVGYLRDTTASYTAALWVVVGYIVLSVVTFVLLANRHRFTRQRARIPSTNP